MSHLLCFLIVFEKVYVIICANKCRRSSYTAADNSSVLCFHNNTSHITQCTCTALIVFLSSVIGHCCLHLPCCCQFVCLTCLLSARGICEIVTAIPDSITCRNNVCSILCRSRCAGLSRSKLSMVVETSNLHWFCTVCCKVPQSLQ